MRDGSVGPLVHVCIDGVGAKEGGGASVLRQVVGGLLRRADVGTVTVFASPRDLRTFALEGDPRLAVFDVALAERGGFSRIWWHSVGLEHACKRTGAAVVLALSGSGGAGDVPVVAFIQQSLPFLSPPDQLLPLCARVRVAVVGWGMRRSAIRATRVVVQTEVMRREVTAKFGVSPARITVVFPDPEAVSPSRGAPELDRLRCAPEGLRILYVGSAKPHKNLSILVEAFMRARTALPGLTLHLTEGHGPQIPRVPGIVALGQLPPPVVREAYGLATCLVMPSVIETVGLPILEAFAFGLPVVVSDRPFAREACGHAALFFDPHNAKALAAALVKVLTDGTTREALRTAGLVRSAEIAATRPYDRIAQILVDEAALSQTRR